MGNFGGELPCEPSRKAAASPSPYPWVSRRGRWRTPEIAGSLSFAGAFSLSFRVLCEKRACPFDKLRASSERSRRGGELDFPCRESNSQWTYARGIPPLATNAKDGAPGPIVDKSGRARLPVVPIRRPYVGWLQPLGFAPGLGFERPPQRLKPRQECVRDGTSETRALPGPGCPILCDLCKRRDSTSPSPRSLDSCGKSPSVEDFPVLAENTKGGFAAALKLS